MVILAALFAVASIITIQERPWVSMLMSFTSIVIIGTLMMAVA
jgi:hypothetical protein